MIGPNHADLIQRELRNVIGVSAEQQRSYIS